MSTAISSNNPCLFEAQFFIALVILWFAGQILCDFIIKVKNNEEEFIKIQSLRKNDTSTRITPIAKLRTPKEFNHSAQLLTATAGYPG